MTKTTLSLALSLALVATMAPSALAGHAGHSYEQERTIESWGPPAAYVTTQSHEYEILDVPEGAQISAVLTWDDAETVDMALEINPPTPTCEVLPSPETSCIVEGALQGAMQAGCDGYSPRGIEGGHEEASVVTDRAGEWTVDVYATLLMPMESVSYELGFTVDAPHGSVWKNDATSVHTDPACFLVE